MPGNARARDAGILSNEIDAQPSDNGASVVSVQTVKGEAVVEQSCRLMEHLTSHVEVHLGPCLSDCLCGCQELIDGGSKVLCGIPRASQCAHVPSKEYGARTAQAGRPSTGLQPPGGC